MSREHRLYKMLFCAITLGFLSFFISWYLLIKDDIVLASRADKSIEVIQPRATTDNSKIELSISYYQKFVESKEEKYLDTAINILEKVDAKEVPFKDYILGVIYLEKNEKELSLKYSEHFLQQAPEYQETQLTRGIALMRLNRYPEAIKALNDFANVRPEIADTYELLDEIYLKLGQKEKAEQYNSKADKLLGKTEDDSKLHRSE